MRVAGIGLVLAACLVGGAHKGAGHGICQCPGMTAEDVVPPQAGFD